MKTWSFKIIEESNNHFHFQGTRTTKNIVECHDSNFDSIQIYKFAYDIELQLIGSIPKAIYNLIDSIILDSTDSQFMDESFGSWFIEFEQNRIVYDGKDNWIKLQINQESSWVDKLILNLNENHGKSESKISEIFKFIKQV